MRVIAQIGCLGLGLALALAGQTAAGSKAAAKDSKTAKASAPKESGGIELPAGAEKVSEGVWRVKDAQGRAWYYARTPFGYSKMDEATYKLAARSSQEPPVTVVSVDGDKVTFERATPFGKSRWVHTRSELTEAEKTALEERQKTAQPESKK